MSVSEESADKDDGSESSMQEPSPWIWLRVHYKAVACIIAPIILCPILFLGYMPSRCAYCILLMSVYWVVEVFPLGVTAFLPVLVLPLLGVISVKDITRTYLNDTNFLLLSSMMVCLAVEDCNLHKRVALKMLSYVGARPQWMMLGFMCVTSFISLFISDTATAALMCPIAYALLETIMIPRMQSSNSEAETTKSIYAEELPGTDVELHGKEGVEVKAHVVDHGLDVTRLSKRDRGICKALMLIVAHAALIGGTGTINSTGPNLIFRATIYDRYPAEETKITYLTWVAFAVPPMFCYMASSWLIVQLQFCGWKYLKSAFQEPDELALEEEERTRSAVTKAYESLGPVSFAEKSVLSIFCVLIVSWITSDPKVFPGWVDLFPKGFVSDSTSGIFVVILLFIWPKEKPDVFSMKEPGRALLEWETVTKRFGWSVILLLGAGFAISKSVQVSGLSALIACHLENHLSTLPHIVMQILIQILVVTLTEFSTNTATASIFVPISFKVAERVRAHPLYFSIPCAIGPSFSFMLPMATSSNAIVYETKTVTILEMASCGLLLNLLCIFFTVVNMNTWTYWLFDMGTYPDYAKPFASNATSVGNATIIC